MSFGLVPLAREHLESFEPGVPDRAAFEEPYLSVLRTYWVGRATCAIGDGIVLGIAGISVSDGCVYPWMVLSAAMRRLYPIHITRLARRILKGIFENENVNRIEVHVDRDFLAGRRWIERLGFAAQHSNQDSMRYVRYGISRNSYHERLRRKKRDGCDLHDGRGRCAQ